MRALNNEIIVQLPGSVAGSAVVVTEPDGFEVTIVGHRPALVPYSHGMDVWMHYHSVGHLMRWAEWLRDILPRLLPRATSLAAVS